MVSCTWLVFLPYCTHTHTQRYTIDGLVHNTSYSVSMAVRNNVDIGNFSQPVENSTLEEGGAYNNCDECHPKSPHVLHVSNHYIFSPPHTHTYIHTHAHTHTVPSDPPQGITPSPISPHTITVTWTPPTMPNGQPSYTVRYLETVRVGQEEWEEVERDVGETNATLDNLRVFTSEHRLIIIRDSRIMQSRNVSHLIPSPSPDYSIQVRAVTSCGEGPYSSSSEATTLQAPSSPPVGVAVGVVTPYSLVVTWEAPEEPNGIIDMYKVDSMSFCQRSVSRSKVSE